MQAGLILMLPYLKANSPNTLNVRCVYLKEDIVHSIAYAFAKRRPADLLTLFRSQLSSINDDNFNDLIGNLLTNNEFDSVKIYDWWG